MGKKNEEQQEEEAVEEKQEKASKNELYLEQLRKAKELAQKTKDDFKKTEYKLLRNDCYAKMDTVVSMVKKGVAISGIIHGKGGTGKTHRMKQLLKDTDYEIIMTKLTPKALYCLLYEFKDADIIWFDDVTRIMKDPLILGFLKSICGDGNSQASKTRTIQYNVSTPIKNAEGEIIPDNFEVTARVLITTNEMPDGKKNGNLDLGAVLSRMKKAKVEIPRSELLKIFAEIVQEPYGDLTYDQRKEVMDFLVANTNDRMSNLNLRILFDGMDYRRIALIDKQGDQWQMNVLDDLERDPTAVYVEKLLQDSSFFNEKERMEVYNNWRVEQGLKPLSQASYYRQRARVIEEANLTVAPFKPKPEEVVAESGT